MNEATHTDAAGHEQIDESVKVVVRKWLAEHNGDIDALAKWMRDCARIGGMKTCRELIRQSVEA